MATSLVYTPVDLDVQMAGSGLNTNLLGATITLSFDQGVSSATLEYAFDPGTPPYNSQVVLTGGTGINDIVRFTGRLKRKRYNLWPPSYSLICRGMLSLADEWKQPNGDTDLAGSPDYGIGGLSLPGLLSAPAGNLDYQNWPTPPTDQNIIIAALNQVPGLSALFDTADIGGTGYFFPWLDQMLWKARTSALAYIQQLDQTCLGYRLYELGSGRIIRTQIYGYPNNVSDPPTADHQDFTEGVDIWDLTADRGIENLINGALVHGYNWGGDAGALLTRYLNQESNDFQPSTEPHLAEFSHPLIGQATTGPGPFLSAQEVAEWQTTEGNKEAVTSQLVTFRDTPIMPGRTITINSPNGGISQPMWVRAVHLTWRTNPVLFQQQFDVTGGGAPGEVAYPPPPLY